MKRYAALFVALGLFFMSGCLFPDPIDPDPDPTPGEVLFFDDFAGGADPAWVATPPGWRTGGGKYTYFPQSYASYSVGYSFVASGKDWQDYTVEADIYLPGEYPRVGIVFRAQEDLNNMVIVWLDVLRIFWHVIQDGEVVASSDIITPGLSIGWQHIKVEAVGSTYILHVEGLLRATFTDSHFVTGMPGVAGRDVDRAAVPYSAVDNFEVIGK